ncbi:MAG TPA: hypothetical protein DCY41_05625, partial [Opitutae bacterium]|nr:hypothetical protein [Opitutae bacterium]
MLSILRSFLQIALGFALGFFVAAYYLPEARSARERGPTTVSKGPSTVTPKSVAETQSHSSPESTNLFGRPSSGTTTSSGSSNTPKPAPAPVSVERETSVAEVVQPKPTTPVSPVVEASVAVEEPVDFRELCIKPAAWPPSITLNREVNAEVMEGEEVIAEIPLSAGERVQVSKVFGDGTVEVRAKGAKFVINAADTDLAAQARVRLAEISGRVRAPTPTERPEVKPEPKVETKPVEKPVATEPS